MRKVLVLVLRHYHGAVEWEVGIISPCQWVVSGRSPTAVLQCSSTEADTKNPGYVTSVTTTGTLNTPL